MMLSGDEIRERLGTDIQITPFEDACVNPNSYSLSLHDELLVYEEVVLDTRSSNRFRTLQIPEEGLILSPGQIYLGRTAEYTETHNLVPMITGKSSFAQLGLFVHCSAAVGDVGFCGQWMLEIFAAQPIRIYAGLKICQIFFQEVSGRVPTSHAPKFPCYGAAPQNFNYPENGHAIPGRMHEYNAGLPIADCGCQPLSLLDLIVKVDEVRT